MGCFSVFRVEKEETEREGEIRERIDLSFSKVNTAFWM